MGSEEQQEGPSSFFSSMIVGATYVVLRVGEPRAFDHPMVLNETDHQVLLAQSTDACNLPPVLTVDCHRCTKLPAQPQTMVSAHHRRVQIVANYSYCVGERSWDKPGCTRGYSRIGLAP